MKLLELNIISFNSSLDELWLYQKKHTYDAIFLQETNFTQNKSLGPYKHWKNKIFTHYKEKTMGFGVGTLIPNDIKNVFREDFSNDSLELLWNEIEIQGQQVLIGNVYIPPNMESHLHLLNKELEKHRGKNLILLGDFNSRNIIWYKNLTRNKKLGNILEDLINQHNLFLLTDVDHTYHHSDLNENAGKRTIDLTLVRGLSSLHIRTRAFDLIKT